MLLRKEIEFKKAKGRYDCQNEAILDTGQNKSKLCLNAYEMPTMYCKNWLFIDNNILAITFHQQPDWLQLSLVMIVSTQWFRDTSKISQQFGVIWNRKGSWRVWIE